MFVTGGGAAERANPPLVRVTIPRGVSAVFSSSTTDNVGLRSRRGHCVCLGSANTT